MNSQIKRLKKQSGFTLIESLLTLFILSIGMLGIAGMQIQGLKSGSLAIQQMAAVMKTQEIMERMRANTIRKLKGLDDETVSTQAIINLEMYDSGTGVNKACINGVECSYEEMALFDLFQWNEEMSNVFPGTVNPSITLVGRTLTVDIQWTDRGTSYNYTVSTQL